MSHFHHYIVMHNDFTILKYLLCFTCLSLSSSQPLIPWQTLFTIFTVLPFSIMSSKRNLIMWIFSEWCFLTEQTTFRIIHVFTRFNSSFLFISEDVSVWMYHNLFIYSPVEGHFDCFQFLIVVNKTAINILFKFLYWCVFSNQLGKYRRA